MAVISTWSIRCGIAEYSHGLLQAFINNPDYKLKVYCDDRTSVVQDNVLPCWKRGENDSVANVLVDIGKSNIQVVLVQHQSSLFSLTDEICQHLDNLHHQGRVIMLELHSTLSLLSEYQPSEVALRSLAKIDRIIVHKTEDLDNLITLGLADTVMLLNLGVIQPLAEPDESATRTTLGIPVDALVLGSFGFLFENKGIDALVGSIKPLMQITKRHVHLLALNSTIDERSVQRLQKYKRIARQLGVDGQISWITDFRKIEECQKILCAADYIVYPYKYSHESVSAAVTIGLSTLKPVLVSPSDIFSDLSKVTWLMQGHEASDIVNAIMILTHQPETVQALCQRQRQWLYERDWNISSDRLNVIIRSLIKDRKLPVSMKIQAEIRAEQAEAKAEQAEAKAEQAEARAEQLHTELHFVYTSRSWRITAPLRWFIHQVRLLRQHGLFSRIKALVKKIARSFI